MSIIDRLSEFFARPADETAGQAPGDVCANCWGVYEYDSKIREIARDRQIDVTNGVERYSFIKDFVVNHIDGIRLRDEGLGSTCPNCGPR